MVKKPSAKRAVIFLFSEMRSLRSLKSGIHTTFKSVASVNAHNAMFTDCDALPHICSSMLIFGDLGITEKKDVKVD